MVHKLVIFLKDNNEKVDAALLDEQGRVYKTILNVILAELAPLAKDKLVIGLIPGHDVLLLQAELPELNRSRLRQALPFALEEKLIGDVGQLHFAVGNTLLNGSLPVAVISQDKMHAWLELLKQAEIEVTALVPTSLALPLWSQAWTVAVFEHEVLVRTEFFHGFACDKANLAALLPLMLGERAEKPNTIHLINYSAEAVSFTTTDCEVNEVVAAPDKSITDLAETVAKVPSINLLQDIYQPKREWLSLKNMWLLAGSFVAAAIILLFLSQIVSYFILSSQAKALDKEIAVIYHHYFPGASAVVAVKTRMQDKLQKLQMQAGGDPLFVLLAAIGKGMKNTPDIIIKRYYFQHEQVTLNLTANSFASLDQFATFLSHQGLTVKQENATAVGDQVKTDLIIRIK